MRSEVPLVVPVFWKNSVTEDILETSIFVSDYVIRLEFLVAVNVNVIILWDVSLSTLLP